MNRLHRLAMPALLGVALLATTAHAADPPAGMTKGTPELKSAGALAFGPNGLLFIGDTKGGSIFAVETGDTTPPPSNATLQATAINGYDATGHYLRAGLLVNACTTYAVRPVK